MCSIPKYYIANKIRLYSYEWMEYGRILFL